MAANTGNKRVATKHIRDGIKSNYKKDCKCAICGTEQDLEMHHYTTVSLLLKKYCLENKISIKTDEEVLAMREDFYTAHWDELVEQTVTLCATHHKLLHKIYGREPALGTADKQVTWVLKLHGRNHGKDAVPTRSDTRFGSLLGETSENRFSRLI